jgi:hypothetical protein
LHSNLPGSQQNSLYGSSQSLSSLLSPSPSHQSPYSNQMGASFVSQGQGQNHFTGNPNSSMGLNQQSTTSQSSNPVQPQLNLSPSLAAQSQSDNARYDNYFR